ncbi:MAG: hypothetical protein ABW034_02145 [Steroidobacteraceae bacterium]
MSITTDDDGPHQPSPGESTDWQESLAFHFFDPRRRIGGFFHTGLQRLIDRADIWSWIAVEGRTVHNFQHLDLRLPKEDFPRFRLGPLGCTTTTPLTGRHLVVADGATQLSLQYDAIFPATHYGSSHSGSGSGHFAKGHFETLGRAVGELKLGNEVLKIDAFAFDDRSWGVRDWRHILTYRLFWAMFGPDLYVIMYTTTSPEEKRTWGFVFDRGTRSNIVDIEMEVSVATNGVFARRFEALLWTDTGGAYRINGQADGNLVVTQRHGFMESPTLCRMEMNGRVGGGVLEFAELKQPTTEISAQFGLMEHPEDAAARR